MEYRNLGRAGLKVSEICLGTMTFGNGADQKGATRMVNAALDAGVTFFDTANSYVGGTSETMTPSSPPSSSIRWAGGPTIPACRGCTSSSRSRAR